MKNIFPILGVCGALFILPLGAAETLIPVQADPNDTGPTAHDLDAMEDALDEAARAARGLGAALLENALEAFGQAESNIAEAAEDMRDSVAEEMAIMALGQAGNLEATGAWLKQEQIISANGVDFDKALAAIEASDMSRREKKALTKSLGSIRAGLAEAHAGLLDFNATLAKARPETVGQEIQEIKQ